MSHLLQPVVELVLIAFFLGYSDGPNNSFNDWFILNTELMQPCRKTVLEVGSVYSKAMCFFNRRLRPGRLGLSSIISSVSWFLPGFWSFFLDKNERCAKCLLATDHL